ncbi:MAG: F0F1 ATP synthase subunit alpha [Patescibacteria group bacterium]
MEDSKRIIESLRREIENLNIAPKIENTGVIIELKDGIARISGLSQCFLSEMLEFPMGLFGVVLNLEEDVVSAVLLGNYNHVREGDTVKTTGQIISVPVGEALLSRVVDALGKPVDGKETPNLSKRYPIEKIAPGVITRKTISVSLETGVKAIDAMIPIGRGQRELIIGDRQTGKTAIAIDTIINQKGKGVICIYCAIGQKESKTARIISELHKRGAMEYTIVVNAPASTVASLQYIAPFSATAIGEYFMDNGKDVLIVYDDLSKHAWAYREISLLLRRPPGREAYPGDVFYLHSRLLERSLRRLPEFGGGSITSLPIVETQSGDVSAYIPTNIISITDGQIYLDTDLFYSGFRPAVNVGLSVSRVGSSAQTKAMKQFAGKLRLDLAQYRELAAFAQFEGDLDESTKKQLERGKRMTEILKQDQYEPQNLARQIIAIFSVTQGLTDDIEVLQINVFMGKLLQFMEAEKKEIILELLIGEKLSDDLQARLTAEIDQFKKIF